MLCLFCHDLKWMRWFPLAWVARTWRIFWRFHLNVNTI